MGTSPRGGQARHTWAVFQRRVEGVVEAEVIVLENGRVGFVKITKLLDPDLEQAAVAAISEWEFAPAMRRGTPVAVYANIELTFKMR